MNSMKKLNGDNNMKAKKIETFYDKWFNTVVYEYRGCKYEVTYANSYQCSCTPAWYQHKLAQKKIDNDLDNPKPIETKQVETVEESLDRFFKYLETGAWEE